MKIRKRTILVFYIKILEEIDRNVKIVYNYTEAQEYIS